MTPLTKGRQKLIATADATASTRVRFGNELSKTVKVADGGAITGGSTGLADLRGEGDRDREGKESSGKEDDPESCTLSHCCDVASESAGRVC